MNFDTLNDWGKKKRRKYILIIGSLAVAFFLLLQIISAAATGIVSILAWQYEECQNAANSASDDGDIGNISVGKYDKDMASMAKVVADAVGKELGIKPEIIFGQIYQETGLNPNLSTAVKDLNLSGMKYAPSLSDYATPGSSVGDNTGGVYAHFKSLDAYATVYAKTLKNMLGGAKPQTAREYATKLASKHYFGSYHGGSFYASEAEIAAYVAGIETGAKIYHSTKGGSSSKGKIKKTAWRNVIQFKDEKQLNKNQEKVIKEILSSAVDIDNPKQKENMNLLYQSKQGSKLILVDKKNNHYSDIDDNSSPQDIKKNYGDGQSHVNQNEDKALQNQQVSDDAVNASKANRTDSTVKAGDKLTGGNGTSSIVKKADKDKKEATQKVKKATDSYENNQVDSSTCSAFGFDTDSEDGGAVSGSWRYPFNGIKVDPEKNYEDGQQFGKSAGSSFRTNSYHDGWDFGSAKYSGNIYAVHGGKVKFIGIPSGVDFLAVWVVSDDGYNVIYQEFTNSKSDIFVKEGQTIKAGTKIGRLTTQHLHLGISKKKLSSPVQDAFSDNGTWLNPIKIIKEGMKKKSTDNSNSESGSSIKLSSSEDAARKWIINRESSGIYTATNGRYYGAYQLDRSYLTGKKYGGDGTLSKKNQDYVAQKYMESRYGTWKKAQAFWQANGWW